MSYCDHLPSPWSYVHRSPSTLFEQPLKPLGQFSSNFMQNLLLKGEGGGGLKICSNGQGPLIKIAAMPTYGKDS